MNQTFGTGTATPSRSKQSFWLAGALTVLALGAAALGFLKWRTFDSSFVLNDLPIEVSTQLSGFTHRSTLTFDGTTTTETAMSGAPLLAVASVLALVSASLWAAGKAPKTSGLIAFLGGAVLIWSGFAALLLWTPEMMAKADFIPDDPKYLEVALDVNGASLQHGQLTTSFAPYAAIAVGAIILVLSLVQLYCAYTGKASATYPTPQFANPTYVPQPPVITPPSFGAPASTGTRNWPTNN